MAGQLPRVIGAETHATSCIPPIVLHPSGWCQPRQLARLLARVVLVVLP